MDFATRLKELRQSKHMTQARLASVLHYGSSAIANYESGRNTPRISDLIRIADFFQVPIDDIVGREFAGIEGDEGKLLQGYGKITTRQKRLVMEIIACFLEEEEKKGQITGN